MCRLRGAQSADQVGWKAQARKTSLNCGTASLDWRWFEISFAEPTPDRTQGKSVSCRSIRSGLAKVRPGNLGRTPKVPSRRCNLAGMWPETATKCPSGEARSPDGSGPFDLRAHRSPSVLLGRRRSDDAS